MTSKKVKYLLSAGILLFIFAACSKSHKVNRDLAKIEKSIEAYHNNYGFYPASLDTLGIEIPADPYGEGPYKYINWENEIVRVYSVGTDRQDDLSCCDMCLNISNSEQEWEVFQIANTKDDSGNGMASLMRTLRAFPEIDNENLLGELNSIISDGWISADETPMAARSLEKYRDLFAKIREHANGPKIKPAEYKLILGSPSPDVARYNPLVKLLIAEGKKLEVEGDSATACENYFATFMLIRACNDSMLIGKLVDMNLGRMAYEALRCNRAIDQQILITKVIHLENESQEIGRALHNELSARLASIMRAEYFTGHGIMDMFFASNRASIGTILTQVYEENIRRFKLPYREFREYHYDFTNEKPLMKHAIKRFDGMVKRNILLRDLLKRTEANGLFIQAALRIYREKHRAYPDRLEELTPDILPEVPLDPFSNEPFIYKKTYFYSVGPDLRDNYAKISYDHFGDVMGDGDIIFGR